VRQSHSSLNSPVSDFHPRSGHRGLKSAVRSLCLALLATLGVFAAAAFVSPVWAAAGTASPTRPPQGGASPNFTYIPYWQVESVSGSYWVAGPWSTCTRGYGPGWLGCNGSHTVSNQISGTVNVSYAVVSGAVGYNVTQSFTKGSSYSIWVPAGSHYAIYMRSHYLQKTVHEDEVLPPRYEVIGYATCYTRQWQYFSYSWGSI